MSKCYAISIPIVVLAIVVVAIIYRQSLAKPCLYSQLRADANLSALRGDNSQAVAFEKEALRQLGRVDEALQSRARQESLFRLATLTLANGQIDDSLRYRGELIDSWKEDSSRETSISVQQKLVEISHDLKDMDDSAQNCVFDGIADAFTADLYFHEEKPYKAIQQWQTAIDNFDSALLPNNLPTALISGRLIELQLRYGGLPDSDQKIKAIREVLTKELGADHPQTVQLLTVEATKDEVAGSWDKYVEHYKAYLEKINKINVHNKQELIAVATQQLAFGYSRSGKFDEALKYYDQSESLIRSLYGEPSVEMAKWMFVRADNYTSTGEWKKGEDLLDGSLENIEQLLKQHTTKWNEPTRNNILRRKAETIHRRALCALYDETKDKAYKLSRARSEFSESKRILDQLGLQKSLRYVFVLRQLCQVEHLAKRELNDNSCDEAAARATIAQACETYQFLCGGKFGPYYRLLLNHRIAMERAWGRYEESINQFFTAVNLDLENPRNVQIAMCLRELGLTYSDMGQPAKAVEAYANAIDMYGEMFFADLFSASESQADGQAEFLRDCLKDMVAAADKSDSSQVRTLFEYISRIKGMVARSRTTRSQLQSKVEKSQREDLSEKLSSVARRTFSAIVKKSQSRDPVPAIDEEIKMLTRQKRELISKIANLISFDDIQFESNIFERLNAVMPDNSTVVEFYFQPSNQIDHKRVYYAFIFEKGNGDAVLTCKPIGDGDFIDELAGRLAGSVSLGVDPVRESRFAKHGIKLRENTWDAIMPEIGEPEIIVICGDGQLSAVPWNGLPSSRNKGQFLVNQFTIVPATNSRDVVENLDKNQQLGSGSLLVGNPKFGQPQDSSPSFGKFSPLRESKVELEIVEELLERFGVVNKLQESEATLRKIDRLLPRVRYAHFATHGFYIGPTEGVGLEHRFAKAALALSYANEPVKHSDVPSFLSGEHLIAMNLTNLDLVVFSACDTARGWTTISEGIHDMQRAVMLAGAKTCIASQWPIGDVEARIFMELFYKNLFVENLSKLESFRTAQIQMHADGYAPETWANWKILGDWR